MGPPVIALCHSVQHMATDYAVLLDRNASLDWPARGFCGMAVSVDKVMPNDDANDVVAGIGPPTRKTGEG